MNSESFITNDKLDAKAELENEEPIESSEVYPKEDTEEIVDNQQTQTRRGRKPRSPERQAAWENETNRKFHRIMERRTGKVLGGLNTLSHCLKKKNYHFTVEDVHGYLDKIQTKMEQILDSIS